jgi:hypothetical protein
MTPNNSIASRVGAGYEFQRQRFALTVRPGVAGISHRVAQAGMEPPLCNRYYFASFFPTSKVTRQEVWMMRPVLISGMTTNS